MKRFRWPALILALLILGGVGSWYVLDQPEPPMQFKFLQGAKLIQRMDDENGFFEAWSLRGNFGDLETKIEEELVRLGFSRSLSPSSTEMWHLANITVVTMPLEEDTGLAATPGVTAPPAAPGKTVGMKVEILLYRQETPWDKLLKRLGIRVISRSSSG